MKKIKNEQGVKLVDCMRVELDMLANADDRFRRHIRCAEQFEPTLLTACG